MTLLHIVVDVPGGGGADPMVAAEEYTAWGVKPVSAAWEAGAPAGCDMCSGDPAGCSFCSGTSAIDILRDRGGEGVIDATTVLERLTPTNPDTTEPDHQ